MYNTRMLMVAVFIVCGSGVYAERVDSTMWMGASWEKSSWDNTRLWTGSVYAKDGGIATVTAGSMQELNVNVSGLSLGGLDLCNLTGAENRNWCHVVGQPIEFVGTDPFIANSNTVGRTYVATRFSGDGANVLHKRGAGRLDFEVEPTDFAAVEIDGGSLAATNGAAAFFPNNAIRLAGGGILFVPSGSSGDMAVTAGKSLSVLAGRSNVTVDKGSASSAALTLKGLSLQPGGILHLRAKGGALGGTERIFASESPAVVNGVVDPRFSSADGRGLGWLTYTAENGFAPASVTTVGLDGADAADFVRMSGDSTLSASKTVYSLDLGSSKLTIPSGTKLTVGNGAGAALVNFSAPDAKDGVVGGGELSFGNAHGLMAFGNANQVNFVGTLSGNSGMSFVATGNNTCGYLYLSYDAVCKWTGETVIDGVKFALDAESSGTFANPFPAGGTVRILGDMATKTGGQFKVRPRNSGTLTYDQVFHLSGQGDGNGAIYFIPIAGTTGSFTGGIVLDGPALVYLRRDGLHCNPAKVVVSAPMSGLGSVVFKGLSGWESGTAGVKGREELTLSAANTYAGTTEFKSLLVHVNGAGTFGEGEVRADADTVIEFNVTSGSVFTNAMKVAGEVKVNSSMTLDGEMEIAKLDVASGCTLTLGRNVRVGTVGYGPGAKVAYLDAASSVTLVDGVLGIELDGAGSLVKDGSGTALLYHSEPYSYTGATSVREGTLKLENDIFKSPDISYWLDATAEGTAVADADGAVSEWSSRSGNGYAFVPASVKNGNVQCQFSRPTVTTLAGKRALSFTVDGTNRLVGASTAEQRTVFVVCRADETTKNKWSGLFGEFTVDYGLRAYQAQLSWQLAENASHLFNTTPKLIMNGVESANSSFASGETQVLCLRHLNDAVGKTRFVPAIGGYSNYNGSDGGWRQFDGAIGEVIAFRSVLSDNERKRVENYLALKWGWSEPFYSDVVDASSQVLPVATALEVGCDGVLDLNGLSQTVGSLSGAGTIVSEKPAVLTVTGTSTFTGTVGENVTLVVQGGDFKARVSADAAVSFGASAKLAGVNVGAPTDGVICWLDASKEDMLVRDGEGRVTEWKSRHDETKSLSFAAGNTSYQGGFADGPAKGSYPVAPPQYQSAGFNGRPAVYFCETNRLMGSGYWDFRTSFVVLKRSAANQPQMAHLFGNGSYCIRYNGNSKDVCLTTLSVGFIDRGDLVHINGADLTGAATATVPADYCILTIRKTAAHAASAIKHQLGADGGNGGGRHWYMELIGYDRALTDDEVAQTEAYLKWKWIDSSWAGGLPPAETAANLAAGAGLKVAGGASVDFNGADATVGGLRSGGGTFSNVGTLTVTGDVVFDVVNGLVSPLAIVGNLTFGQGAQAVIDDWNDLDRSHAHQQALSVTGTVTGDLAAPVLRKWIWSRSGNVWSVDKGGLILFVR